jgi:hypothetical protein
VRGRSDGRRMGLPDGTRLKEVSSYDFAAIQEFKLMDHAIERLAGQSRHLKIAKCQLLRQHGRIVESRNLLDKLKQDIPNITEDPHLESYVECVETCLYRDESRILDLPNGFGEVAYLNANPDMGTSKNIRLRRDDRRLRSPRGRFDGRRPFIEAI